MKNYSIKWDIEFSGNVLLGESYPYVFLNGDDDDGLFIIKSLGKGSFEYLDQRFTTKTFTFKGELKDFVRLADDKEKSIGHRL
ncbi:hypothetical protein [Acinetobacter oleivorans]|uniref:hypothetical protein n=1 Tax=Acinetobacter oleivorans TaxID=1148157 RepID=UPI00124CCF2B|nr:hypothetical protein [Acinetobacter oleivorans]